MNFRTIEIISDGTLVGTFVVDAQSGEPIEGVQNVQLEFDCELGLLATIEISNPKVRIHAPKPEGDFPA